jgi:hypothetical protein
MLAIAGKGIAEVTVLSPYFDEDGVALAEIAKRTGAPVTARIQPKQVGLSSRAAARLPVSVSLGRADIHDGEGRQGARGRSDRDAAVRNASVPPDRRIEFRIGIHQGDIIVEDGDIFGDRASRRRQHEQAQPLQGGRVERGFVKRHTEIW